MQKFELPHVGWNEFTPVLDKELARAFLIEKAGPFPAGKAREEFLSDDVLAFILDNFPRILPWLHHACSNYDSRGRVTKDNVLSEWHQMHIPYGEGFLTDEQIRQTDKRLRFDILAWKIKHREELDRARAFRRRVYGER